MIHYPNTCAPLSITNLGLSLPYSIFLLAFSALLPSPSPFHLYVLPTPSHNSLLDTPYSFSPLVSVTLIPLLSRTILLDRVAQMFVFCSPSLLPPFSLLSSSLMEHATLSLSDLLHSFSITISSHLEKGKRKRDIIRFREGSQ